MATILLVEDSKTLLMYIQRMLIQGGHEVIPATSGQQGVALLQRISVDLILTDLYMPPPDGFELVDAVRAMSNPPPLIVMSSNSQACEIFSHAQLLGASATLRKPFTSHELCSTIDRVLRTADRAQELPFQRAV